MASTGELPPAVLDAAIGWLVKLQSGTADAALHAACQRWRAADPVHEQAWRQLQWAEEDFRLLPAGSAALACDTLIQAEQLRSGRQGRRRALKTLVLGGSVLGLGWQLGRQRDLLPPLTADFRSATGERRQWTLEDGTRLTLNTRSAVDLRFSAHERLLVLLRGEIHIDSGSDAAYGGTRPLRVRSAQGLFQVLGTRFHLRQEEAATLLSVSEGAVALPEVSGRATTAQQAARAGEVWRITAGKAHAVRDAAFDPAAWTDGVLVARQMRLADAVAEIGRYRSGWLRCDPAVADWRISGVFQLGDTDLALAALGEALPLRIRHYSRYWVMVEGAR
ncbi:transmembrane sensor [Thauera linaloolentis 47Lol = DSM 12138]|uniref:Transmembrane sensor n=2 Tax=Thauera linaloolentis TaxID=76112 RepID=N6ZBQ5_THAL4|nr:transmembrane sensor [Thauera linaloolentis 47Lol = DSM 12138]